MTGSSSLIVQNKVVVRLFLKYISICGSETYLACFGKIWFFFFTKVNEETALLKNGRENTHESYCAPTKRNLVETMTNWFCIYRHWLKTIGVKVFEVIDLVPSFVRFLLLPVLNEFALTDRINFVGNETRCVLMVYFQMLL